MTSRLGDERARLALLVWGVFVSQVFLYPGLADVVAALGAPPGIAAGMWFLVAEFAGFVVFASLWGALSDATGKRRRWIVVGALGGASTYALVPQLPSLGVGFAGVIGTRFLGGALTIGALSLGITMLMDLTGGHGRNMGAAGIAIGLGAAVGSVVGGQLSAVDPLAPLYGGAAVLVAVAFLASTLPDRAPSSDGESSGGRSGMGAMLASLRERPTLGVPYAFGFVDRLTAGFFSLVGVFYFRDVFGLDAVGAGLTLALFFFPFALLQYPLGAYSDRIGRFVPVVVGSMLYGVAIVAVGVAPSYPVAALGMVAVGVCGALVAPATMALVTDLAEPSTHGVAMGGFNVFGSVGFLAGFLVGGTVVEATDYLTAFLVVGGMEVAIALALFPLVRRIAPAPEQPVPAG